VDSPISRVYGQLHQLRRHIAARLVRVPPSAELRPDRVRRVLLVCTGLMGDTLMCLPAMACARDLFPGAEVVGLVTESVRGLLELTACFDRFIVADGAPLSFRLGRRADHAALEVQLADGAFDVAVIFLGDDYAPMVTRVGIPSRVFVYETPYRRLADRSYCIGEARTWGPEERFGAWRALGLEPRRTAVGVAAPAAAVSEMDARLGELPGPIVVLHPFGRTPEQRWPQPAWEALARLVRTDLGGTAILIGGPPPTTSVEEAAGLQVMGLLPMSSLVALIGRADCVVSTDSGPLHLAGVMGRPGVGLFRASRPEHSRRYPWIDPIVGAGDPACSAACSWVRCRTLPCAQMERIAAPVVLEAVRRRIHAGTRIGGGSGTELP
jgi:ADP-heptose:LPS heptosyltransferase